MLKRIMACVNLECEKQQNNKQNKKLFFNIIFSTHSKTILTTHNQFENSLQM